MHFTFSNIIYLQNIYTNVPKFHDFLLMDFHSQISLLFTEFSVDAPSSLEKNAQFQSDGLNSRELAGSLTFLILIAQET